MTTDLFTHVALDKIAASATNPRKTFDAGKLAELADSIRATGVHQPILLRPLPGARVPDTGPGIEFEIVSGERRWRASQQAGARTVPALVRPMTDAQVLEVQLIENLQRDDLGPLEEAEGYEHLLQATGIDRPALAAKIGKSLSYVHARMKLLALGPEGRAALADGRLDASRALLVARIPSTELQAQALEDVLHEGYDGETMSYREAAQYIQREFMLRLKDARFDLADATLADAPACQACPLRSGANPDLFADVKGGPEVCTDPACFRRKEEAHAARQVKAAIDSGATVITGREARELMPNSWSTAVEGYARLDDRRDSPTDETLRELLQPQIDSGACQPVLVANPHEGGELIAVVPREQLPALLAQAGQDKVAEQVKRSHKIDADYERRAEQQKAEDALEQGWRAQVVAELVRVGEAGDDDPADLTELDEVLRYVTLHFINQMNADKAKPLARLLDLGKVAPKAGLQEWAKAHEWPATALLLVLAHRDGDWSRYLHEHGQLDNKGLMLACAALEVDPHAIEREARANAKRAAAEAKQAARAEKAAAKAAATVRKAPPPNAPAALASGVPGAALNVDQAPAAPAGAVGKGKRGKARWAAPAPTLGEAEARQGIAAAMQGDEAPALLRTPAAAPGGGATAVLAVGQQVKVLATVSQKAQKPFAGKTGQIVAQIGPEAWDVRLATGRKGSGLATVVGFHQSELEAV